MLSFNSFRKSQPARIGVVIGFALLLMVAAEMKEPRRSQAASRQRQSLTFEDRVAAQRAIEEVYWRHRIWPKENPLPKPPLDEVTPEEALRAKAADYLRMSRALEVYWQRPITGEQMQAEIERMARQTKQPEVLRELWAALGNDPFIIAECLARPLLAERLIRSLYASDERIHGELKRRAEAELSRPDAAAQMRQMSGEYRETKWIKAERAAGAHNRIEQPGTFLVDAEQWQEQVNKLTARVRSTGFSRVLPHSENLPEGGTPNTLAEDQLPLWQLSGLQEDEEKFHVAMVMEQSAERIKVASVEWKKVSFDEWWGGVRAEVESDLEPPRFGSRLPEIETAFAPCGSESWIPTNHIPAGRSNHTSIWTGSEMIVWGGVDDNDRVNTGGRYNPSTNTWIAINLEGAPSPREDAPKNSKEQQTVSYTVKARFNRSEQDRRLVDKEAFLVFDDATQKLSVRCPEKPLEVQYDEVQKVIFEASTRMQGGVTAKALGVGIGAGVGGIAGAIAGAAIQTGMDNRFTRSYWFYLEYKKPDGSLNLYLVETDKRTTAQVIEKARVVFGARVTITSFDEKAEEIKKNQLKDLKSKHSLDVDRENRPMPELKPGKALVVFVCPPMAARYTAKAGQYKFHANDQVVAVCLQGTYSFDYFDPGDYLLAAHSKNAVAMSIKLEAGKDYYIQQDITWGVGSGLARHSKELAMYEISGTYFANWKRK